MACVRLSDGLAGSTLKDNDMTFNDYWQQCTEGIPPTGLYTADTVRELCRNAYHAAQETDNLLVDAAKKVLRVHGNGQPKQMADAVLLIDAALKCRGTLQNAAVLIKDLRKYADIAEAGDKPHWAKTMLNAAELLSAASMPANG